MLNPPQSDTVEIIVMFSANAPLFTCELELILYRATKDKCAIAIFDYSSWDPIRAIILLILLIPHIFIIMPFAGTFSWMKMFWTLYHPCHSTGASD